MTSNPVKFTLDDKLVDQLLIMPESRTFEVKRLGAKSTRVIESVVAMANTEVRLNT